MNQYKKIFVLKDEKQRKIIDFCLYASYIRLAEQMYNSTCATTKNKKHITVIIFSDHLEFEILSQYPLKHKYVGIALKFFSQILVQNYGFLPFCTNTNPRKLFVTA